MINYSFRLPNWEAAQPPRFAAESEEVQGLFHEVEAILVRRFGFSPLAAATMIREYKLQCRLWINEQTHLGLFHDDELLLHEGPGGAALWIYYFVVVKGARDHSSFLNWRKDFMGD